MKIICQEQYLHAISGGATVAYSFITGTTAIAVGAIGGLIGVALAGRARSSVAVVVLPIGGAFVGTVGGYTVGAVSYTIGNNIDVIVTASHTIGNTIGAIVTAPFKIVDFLFQPST